ncbi:DUF3189 family protein [Clostridium sp. BJN0013]
MCSRHHKHLKPCLPNEVLAKLLRKLHWVSFGRPIVTKGTQQAYMLI